MGTAEGTIEILRNAGYSFISGAMPLSNNAFAYLYTKEKEVLAVFCYYNNKSCRFNFKKIRCYGVDDNDNNFSWNHLANVLYSKMNPSKPRDRLQPVRRASTEDLAVLDTINKQGTIKFIKRLAVVTNFKGSFNFYAIYDTKRELNKVKHIIKNF